MKINIGDYRVFKKYQKYYLKIDIDITLPNNQIKKSGATILLSPVGYFCGRVPSVSTSFLYFSSIVYAIDRSVERKKYSVDGWSRDFEVEFKIPSYSTFNKYKAKIESLLSFLTGDYWSCSFSASNPVSMPKWRDSTLFEKVSQVNLFSGGLDSLIGAIDYMEKHPSGQVFLASHHDSDMGGPKIDQNRLMSEFIKKYPGRFLSFPRTPSVLIKSSISDEATCRSRSLMFIAIALQMSLYNNVDIVVPENGSVSLNYPLSVSRRSSCSTRTTHPVVLAKLRDLFSVFSIPTTIYNPYEFLTKREMVERCANKNYLLSVAYISNSCGKRNRRQFFYEDHNASHCGRCMPCMYRKAALLGHDNTSYGITLDTLFKMKSSRLSDDFFAMLNFLKEDLTDEGIKSELRIAGMGTLPDLAKYVELLKRTRAELRNLISAECSAEIKRYIGVC